MQVVSSGKSEWHLVDVGKQTTCDHPVVILCVDVCGGKCVWCKCGAMMVGSEW